MTYACSERWSSSSLFLRHGCLYKWEQESNSLALWPSTQKGDLIKVGDFDNSFYSALDSSGKINLWGGDAAEGMRQTMPAEVKNGITTDIVQASHALVTITDGSVYSWYYNASDNKGSSVVFTKTKTERAVQIAGCWNGILIRTSKNKLLRWAPQLKKCVDVAALPKDVRESKIVDICSMWQHVGSLEGALDENGKVYLWRGYDQGDTTKILEVSRYAQMAAGGYIFLRDFKGDAFAFGVKGGDYGVDKVFPGADVKTDEKKMYALKKVGFSESITRVLGGNDAGCYALSGEALAEVTLQEAYAFPGKVRTGSDLAFCWRVDNDGPVTAKGIEVTVTLPDKVALHSKHQSHLDNGIIKKTGDRTYVVKVADLPSERDSWTPGLTVTVAAGASGTLTASATVTATNIVGPTPSLDIGAQVVSGDKGGNNWDSRDDDYWKHNGGGGPVPLPIPFPPPPPPPPPVGGGGGGGGGGGNSNRPKEPKKERKKDEKNTATLKVSATAEPKRPVAGATVTMSWTVSNTGKAQAKGPNLVVTVPSGLTIKKAEPEKNKGTARVTGSHAAIFHPGDLAKSTGKATVKITATVDDDPPELIAAVGIAGAFNATPAEHTLQIRPKAQVKLDLPKGKAEPAKPAVGKDVTFTWTLTNKGPSTAKKVVFTATVPKGLTNVVVKRDGTTLTPKKQDKNKLIFDLPDMKKSGSCKLSVTGKVAKDAERTMVAGAQVEAAAAAPVKADATAHLRTVLECDGEICGVVTAGQTATYLWTVTNKGAIDAEGVEITMPLPPAAKAKYKEALPTPASTAGPVHWKLGKLLKDAKTQVMATFSVDHSQSRGKLEAIQATAWAENADKAPSKRKPSADIKENSVLDITGTNGAKVEIGKAVTFGWTLVNTGPSDAKNLTVTVTAPADVTGGTVASSKGTVNGNIVTIDTLAPGKDNAALVTLSGTLNAAHAGPVTATAAVAEGGTEKSSDTATVIAVSTAALTVAAAAGNVATAVAGKPVTLSWTAGRTGSGPLAGTFVELGVPSTGVKISAISVGGHALPGPIDPGKALAPIDPALTSPVTVAVTYEPDPNHAAGGITVTATPRFDNAPKNITAVNAPLNITREAAFTLRTQRSSPTPLLAGQTGQLFWNLTNDGPSSCSEVTLTVPKVTGLTITGATVNTTPVTFTDDGKKAVIPVGDLPAGDIAQIMAVTDVAATAQAGSPLVTAKAAGKNPVASKDDAKQLGLARRAAVTATPTAAPQKCKAKDSVTYIWTVHNAGPSAADVCFTVTAVPTTTTIGVLKKDVIGGEVTKNTAAAVEITYQTKANSPLAPGDDHQLSFIVTMGELAGSVTYTTKLTVNGQVKDTTPDHVTTTVEKAPAKVMA